jgi:hypothetical protein
LDKNKAVLNVPVDLRSSRFAFRGRFGGASSALKRLQGLPCPVLPQDIELASLNPPTHEGNAIAFSRSLAPSAPINIVSKSTMTVNTSKNKKPQPERFRLRFPSL